MIDEGGIPHMPFLIILGFVATLATLLIILLTVVGLVLFGGGA
ncbi:hypothetical protein ES703_94912 [subsurface metagenome]